MTNTDTTRIFLAGSDWAEFDAERRMAPLLERGERIKAADLVLVWVADDGSRSERALLDVCFAATNGVPYGVASRSGLYWNRDALLFNHGARIVLGEAPDECFAITLAAALMHHNPKGAKLWPYEVFDVTRLLERAESPIEERLAIHLACAIGPEALIVPQHEVVVAGAKYRLDFAIDPEEERIAVECDGHEFHERTKEQAARDKGRDRALQAAGWRVLRFTGSEIWADPGKCAREVHGMIGSHGSDDP